MRMALIVCTFSFFPPRAESTCKSFKPLENNLRRKLVKCTKKRTHPDRFGLDFESYVKK